MVSKELLEVVLNQEFSIIDINTHSDYKFIAENIIKYYPAESTNWIDINIYELANKCKEWAVNQGYIIIVEPYDYTEDNTFSGTYWWIRRKEDNYGCPNCGANKSEPEAIFKACEWILKETK